MEGAMNRNVMVVSILSVIVLSLLFPVTSCAKAELNVPAPLPAIPTEYYACTPVDALTLIDTYYLNYNAPAQSDARYTGMIFVLKNIPITQKQLNYLKTGFIWVEMIQCSVTNSDYLKYFKVGDKVDVVGKNNGMSKEFRGLEFSNCFVVPSGMVELPASGQGGAFIGGY